jgi:hypothetical protein
MLSAIEQVMQQASEAQTNWRRHVLQAILSNFRAAVRKLNQS